MNPGERLWAMLLELDRFLRLHFVGFAAVWCLLGGWSVTGTLTAAHALPALGVAFCFHVFAYVLNDVIDLPVDRTHPSRQADPLVRGAIRPGTALTVALAQIPLAFGLLVAAGATMQAFAALAAGFVLMGIYDLWGKRSVLPPATDLAQGLGWGAVAYVGAGITGHEPGPLTHVLFAYGAGHIFLINGIHGGLRDLENDLRAGRVTTAAFLGARVGDDGVRSTRAIVMFTLILQLGLAAMLVGSVLANYFGYAPHMIVPAAFAACLLSLLLLYLAYHVARPELPGWDWSMRIHLFLIPFSLVVLFLPVTGAGWGILIVLIYALPGVLLDFTRRLIRRTLGAGVASRSSEGEQM